MDKNTTLTFTVENINQTPVELVDDPSAPSWDDFLASGCQPSESEETAHDNEEVENQKPQSYDFLT